MKAIKLLLLLFVISCIACVDQKGTNEERKSMASEEFNITRFNAMKDSSDMVEITDDEGRFIVRFGNEQSGYHESISVEGDLLEDRKEFHPNGKLRAEGKVFPRSCLVGTWVMYDSLGKRTESVDYESLTPFQWSQVVEYCEQNKVDLRMQSTSVHRKQVDGKWSWIIQWKLPVGMDLVRMTLDGMTGEEVKEQLIRANKN